MVAGEHGYAPRAFSAQYDPEIVFNARFIIGFTELLVKKAWRYSVGF
jgi:hypothetical protein